MTKPKKDLRDLISEVFFSVLFIGRTELQHDNFFAHTIDIKR